MAPRAVLLDIDGTLVLSNDAHARAWEEALAEQGVRVPAARIRPLIGMGGGPLLEALGLSEDRDPGRAASDRRPGIFRERWLPRIAPAPGARALLERLAREGIERIAATSAPAEEVDALLDRAGVRDLVPLAIHADEVQTSKPAPDLVRAALARIGRRPDEAVLLGDTPYDLAAAQAAGLAMIAVRCGGWDFVHRGPVAIYDDPLDLLAHWDTSPLAA